MANNEREMKDFNNMEFDKKREAIVMPERKVEEINFNKPWRIVIRRRIADGGSYNENIHGN